MLQIVAVVGAARVGGVRRACCASASTEGLINQSHPARGAVADPCAWPPPCQLGVLSSLGRLKCLPGGGACLGCVKPVLALLGFETRFIKL